MVTPKSGIQKVNILIEVREVEFYSLMTGVVKITKVVKICLFYRLPVLRILNQFLYFFRWSLDRFQCAE